MKYAILYLVSTANAFVLRGAVPVFVEMILELQILKLSQLKML